jgi:DNA-directed RNA polymerase omega subunit
MTDEPVTEVPEVAPEAPEAAGAPDVAEPPRPIAPPIRSRFLFVDIAAQRAKQLRRGARPRVEMGDGVHKLERVAMREVSGGYVDWNLPAYKGAGHEATS